MSGGTRLLGLEGLVHGFPSKDRFFPFHLTSYPALPQLRNRPHRTSIGSYPGTCLASQ